MQATIASRFRVRSWLLVQVVPLPMARGGYPTEQAQQHTIEGGSNKIKAKR
jgi:hypothetical protein